MKPKSTFSQPLWSITELNRYLRDLLESDELLQDLWVQGEISNLARPASGHLYFTLKDAGSALRCVMWRNAVQQLSFQPRDGMSIQAHGSLSVYEVSGQYQMYIDEIRPAGEGALYQEFLRLKARLESEGLFDPARKKAIPPYPKVIGIVTSPTGAALQDMLNAINRRFPSVEVIVSPTQVQGIDAPAGIISAIARLTRKIQPDVILLARGGGSIEDLWAFNDENVARAIAASSSPIITGVGHETDFTIADFVSDLRAPTPTAAAELATPNRIDLLDNLAGIFDQLDNSIEFRLAEYKRILQQTNSQLDSRSPSRAISTNRQRLDELLHLTQRAIQNSLDLRRASLMGMQRHLNALDPENVLRRGYAILQEKTGEYVTSVQQVASGDELIVRMHDGSFTVNVKGENDDRSST